MYRTIGRGLAQNITTGERFAATASTDWTPALEAWKADLDRFRPLEERLLRRAARRGEWGLFRAVCRRIRELRLPCPMPAGHLMFGS